MDVMQAIKERRSVRRYQERPVPEETLQEILEAVRLAPSASNRQDWHFVIVKDAQQRRKLAEAAGQPFVGTAPVVIAGVSLNPERVMSCEVPAYAVDLAIAMSNITLVAAGRGLGTCWIGAFNQKKVQEILGVPERYKIVQLMPLGYPADRAGEKNRKMVGEISSLDRFEAS